MFDVLPFKINNKMKYYLIILFNRNCCLTASGNGLERKLRNSSNLDGAFIIFTLSNILGKIL